MKTFVTKSIVNSEISKSNFVKEIADKDKKNLHIHTFIYLLLIGLVSAKALRE